MRTAITISLLVLLLTALVGCGRKSSVKENPTANAGKTVSGAEQKSQKSASENANAKESEKPADKGGTALKVVSKKLDLFWQEASGKSKMKAKAVELVGSPIAGTVALKQVDAELFDNGNLTATLKAPLIYADEKTRVVTASGGVTIVSAAPNSSIRTIKVDRVKWFSKEDKLIGDGGVVANGPMSLIKGAGFTADTRLQTVTVFADPARSKAVFGKHY